MKRTIFLLTIALSIIGLQSHANPINPKIKPPHLFVYAIPGQNGQGSEAAYIREVLTHTDQMISSKACERLQRSLWIAQTRGSIDNLSNFEKSWLSKMLLEGQAFSDRDNHRITIVPVKTPHINPDLGQSRCLKELHETLSHYNTLPDSHPALSYVPHKAPGIIHATSQGTATALNYVALTDKGKQVKGLILEAPLLSGNSAIYHTMSGPLMNLQWLTGLPCSYYWLSYCAKAVFPYYWPAGKQSITLLDQIPTDMPVIIIHSKNDPQLSYDDTCALYYGLKKQGNNNVYFIRKEGMRHLNLIESAEDACVIQTILKKHQILDSKGLAYMINLSAYQPDHLQFKQQYDTLLRKEIMHKRLGYTLATSSILGVAYSLYHLAKRVKHTA